MRVVPRIGSPVPFWQGSLATPSVGDGGFFVQKIINEYRSPPRPFPDRMPPFRVRFDMHLIARDHGTYGFELDSPWDGALDVDGNRVFGSGPMAPGGGHEGEIVLTAGVHAVTLQVQPAGDPERPIRLLWKEPTKKLRPVAAADVTDPTDPRTHALRTRLAKPIAWVGALLSSFLVVAWVSRVKGDSTRDVALAASVVVAVGFLARAANFDSYPRTDLDETHNAWAGFNLLHEGHPRSWGWHPIYRSTRVSWFSYDYPIVPDAFDHTPLLPVLVGIEATVLGARTMFDCVLPRIRPLMVLVGTLSVAALFFLGRELFGFHIAFVAGILMACSPLVVFNSRLVKEDGLVQLFLLLSVFAYARGGRSARVSSHWLTGIWSGLAAFSKVMGVSIGFGLAAVALAHHRRVAPAARILMATLVLAALYPLYGIALDSETFRALTTYLS
ncbi:MAG TPA: glycosyltransferase family 39 protein, partial [Vicinamibacteria bacterium]|nr:glycosyltransferase family 39 protein [Vicinamibacteria bacterium]